MLGILADVRFPMPATFAFLTVGFGNKKRIILANRNFQRGYIDEFTEQF